MASELVGGKPLRAPVIAKEIPEPETPGEYPHGSVFEQDSGHMGYSYWLVLDTYEGKRAWELLPRELEPRCKAISEVREKAEFQGVATKRFIGHWHHELPIE